MTGIRYSIERLRFDALRVARQEHMDPVGLRSRIGVKDADQIFFLLPVKKLSTQITSLPSCNNRSHKNEPRKPAPPVTRIRVGINSLSK